PRMELAFAASEAEAGRALPGGLRYVSAADAALDSVDLVFSCLPPGESAPWVMRAAEAGALVVDLSSDFRDGTAGAVYGLPELWREELRAARLIANPGRHPSAALLARAPAVRVGRVDAAQPVISNAAAGVAGAGPWATRA